MDNILPVKMLGGLRPPRTPAVKELIDHCLFTLGGPVPLGPPKVIVGRGLIDQYKKTSHTYLGRLSFQGLLLPWFNQASDALQADSLCRIPQPFQISIVQAKHVLSKLNKPKGQLLDRGTALFVVGIFHRDLACAKATIYL